MATTSNLYQFTDSSAYIMEDAFDLCLIRKTGITQAHIDTFRKCLNFVFSDWANKGINLWAVDLQVIPLAQGVPTYAIDPATIAILDSYVSNVQGQTTTDRILTSMSRSEYATFPNKFQQGTPSRIWYDQLAPSQIYNSTLLSSITDISGTGFQATLTYTGTEALAVGAPIRISGCSIDGYNTVALVTSSFVDSGVVTVNFPSLETQSVSASGSLFLQSMTGPTITLYQAPNGVSFQYLKFYRLRQNQFADLSNGQLPEIPYAWMNAFTNRLAFELSRRWAKELSGDLKAEAIESYEAAAGRNIEQAPLMIVPEYGSYAVL